MDEEYEEEEEEEEEEEKEVEEEKEEEEEVTWSRYQIFKVHYARLQLLWLRCCRPRRDKIAFARNL